MFTVPMPEAPVHKDHFLPAREDDVWLTGQLCVLKSVSVAERGKEPPDDALGLRVTSADTAHTLAAFRRGQRVGAAAQ